MLIRHTFAATCKSKPDVWGRSIFRTHKEPCMTEMLSPFQGQTGALWKVHQPAWGVYWQPPDHPCFEEAVCHTPPELAQGTLPQPPSSALFFPFLTGVSPNWDLKPSRKHSPNLPHGGVLLFAVSDKDHWILPYLQGLDFDLDGIYCLRLSKQGF